MLYLAFTHSPHLLPPYDLLMLFWRLEMVAYSRGRRAGIYSAAREQENARETKKERDSQPQSRYGIEREVTYTRKRNPTITAFRLSTRFLQMMDDEFTAWGSDDSSAV